MSLPGLVVALDGQVAEIETMGQRRRASILARPEVKAGDWVLFEAGLVHEVITSEEAAAITQALEEYAAVLELEESTAAEPRGL